MRHPYRVEYEALQERLKSSWALGMSAEKVSDTERRLRWLRRRMQRNGLIGRVRTKKEEPTTDAEVKDEA